MCRRSDGYPVQRSGKQSFEDIEFRGGGLPKDGQGADRAIEKREGSRVRDIRGEEVSGKLGGSQHPMWLQRQKNGWNVPIGLSIMTSFLEHFCGEGRLRREWG